MAGKVCIFKEITYKIKKGEEFIGVEIEEVGFQALMSRSLHK